MDPDRLFFLAAMYGQCIMHVYSNAFEMYYQRFMGVFSNVLEMDYTR